MKGLYRSGVEKKESSIKWLPLPPAASGFVEGDRLLWYSFAVGGCLMLGL